MVCAAHRAYPICRPSLLFLAAWTMFGVLPSSASAEEPPPAPANMQAMLDAGDVKIEFYNPQTNPRRFLGETKYDYFFRHSFQTEYEPVQIKGRTTAVQVRLRNVSVTTKHKHTIHLPENRRGAGLWKDSLTRHEFDHVSLSIDPRIEVLLQEVFRQVQEIRLPLPVGQELTAAWLNKEIDNLFSARGQAVYAIVSYNNKMLDQLTAHGTKPIPEREAYFDRLYTKPNLDEAGFKHTGEVLELLKSEAYQLLEPRYLSEEQ